MTKSPLSASAAEAVSANPPVSIKLFMGETVKAPAAIKNVSAEAASLLMFIKLPL